MVRALSKFFLITCLVACAGAKNKESVFDVVNIMSKGKDGLSSEFCSAFSLTKEEVQHFFNNAKIVSIKEIHDEYSFLPCFVTGSGTLNKSQCEWEIRAGGTSSIVCGERQIFMACEDCLPLAN